MIFFVKKEKTTLNINWYKDSRIKVTHTELQAWTGWTMRCQISRQSKPSWMTKIRTTSLQPQCGQNEKYKNTMNNNTHEINTTKIQKSRPQAPNLSAVRMRQVITKTPNPFITICSNRRIESRKLNWKAESKLDTKNSEYIKMLGQSVEEGLDKKAKVDHGILKDSLNMKSELTALFYCYSGVGYCYRWSFLWTFCTSCWKCLVACLDIVKTFPSCYRQINSWPSLQSLEFLNV